MADVGKPAPEVYRLSIEKLPRAVSRAHRLALLGLVVGATALTAALTLVIDSLHDAIDAGLAVGSIALVTSPYFLWRAGRRVRRHWNAFELSIGAETVRAAAKGRGRVSIRRDEIMHLVEDGGGLTVHGPGAVLRVPLNVEGYGDMRARLAAGRPIARRREGLYWSAGLVAAGLATGGLVLVARSAVMVVLALVACQLTLAGVAAIEIFTNPVLSGAAKARAIVVAVLSVALPIAAVLR